jgi:hypothetical protein
VLLNIFAFVEQMPSLYPAIMASDLNDLAKKLESLRIRFIYDATFGVQAMTEGNLQRQANEYKDFVKDINSVLYSMKNFTPSVALPFISEAADGTQVLTLEPTGGDLHVWPWLEDKLSKRAAMYKVIVDDFEANVAMEGNARVPAFGTDRVLEEELRRKAELYNELARLCTDRLVPTRATFKRIAYIWPVLYVTSKTGKPHYAALSRLLNEAGIIDKTPKQLKVAFNSIRREYPGVLQWMEIAADNSTENYSYPSKILQQLKEVVKSVIGEDPGPLPLEFFEWACALWRKWLKEEEAREANQFRRVGQRKETE